MIESDTDRLSFFNPDEFGVLCVHSTSRFYGLFETTTIDYSGGITVVSTTSPLLLCRTNDVSGVEQEDTLRVGSTDYTITDIQDDGTGITTLSLHKV